MSNIEQLKDISMVAYEFIRDFSPDDYADGRYELQEGCYVNIESYTTQFRAERRFEAHKKYIDVQYMICGKEIITVCPIEKLKSVVIYDSERDIVFFRNEPKGIDHLLSENDYLVIRPGEAHMPCICIDMQTLVRKAVVKIPVY